MVIRITDAVVKLNMFSTIKRRMSRLIPFNNRRVMLVDTKLWEHTRHAEDN